MTMKDELEKLLNPDQEIPLGAATAFLHVTKMATVEEKKLSPVQDAKVKGALSGIRSAVAGDIGHAARFERTKGERIGKNVGTAAGATAGYLAGRAAKKGGWKSRAAGTAIGAILGRGVGKDIGEASDAAKIVKKYTPKTKTSSIDYARALWKMAQGEPMSEAMDGSNGVAQSDAAVEPGMIVEPAPPNSPGKLMPAPTPEDMERMQAEEQLALEAQADEAAEQNAAAYYKQMSDELGALVQQLQGQVQEAGMAAQQAGEQNQMLQQQTDMATQQSAEQAQQAAQQNQQLSSQLEQATQETMAAKDNIMQMRQAMQSYRENLQQLALTDPAALAGPSPEEQGMAQQPSQAEQVAEMGGDQKAITEAQQADQATQEAQTQQQQAEQEAAMTAAKQQAAEEQAAAQEEQAAAAQGVPKTAGIKSRLIGAGVGAGLGAGIQSVSDMRNSTTGESAKESYLRSKLRGLEKDKKKGALGKHETTITRALYETAKTNREHPRSAAILAGLTGAAAGATFGPRIGTGIKGAFKAIASRGGKK